MSISGNCSVKRVNRRATVDVKKIGGRIEISSFRNFEQEGIRFYLNNWKSCKKERKKAVDILVFDIPGGMKRPNLLYMNVVS